jgi:MoxR-like ATPase
MRAHFSRTLVERDDEIDATAVALASGYHLLLVGPPGVAKSMLLHGVAAWFGGSYFDYQLTKFTTPDELFGGVDILALRRSELRLAREGMMLDADFVFLDEVFNAGSALLNSMLSFLNEGYYRFGASRHEARRLLVVAASNRYPGGESGNEEGQNTAALYDRFLIRLDVSADHSREGWRRLMRSDPAAFDLGPPPGVAPIAREELEAVRRHARSLPFAAEADEAFFDIHRELTGGEAEKRVAVSPRRVTQARRIVQAAAALDGSPEVRARHLAVLKHVLWSDAGEERKRVAEVVGRLADPSGERLTADLVNARAVWEKGMASSGGGIAELTGHMRALGDIADAIRGRAGDDARAAAAVAQVEAWNADLARHVAKRTKLRLEAAGAR